MKKLITVLVLGITIVSCSYESVYNTTTTTTTINETDNSHDNNYYYNDSTKVGFTAPPWKDKDTLITIGG